jgi:two-component system chemotaxis sensor kinase CheA
MNLEAALQTFIVESRELLQSMEDSLLLLEREPDNADAMNATFRAAHTIKGSAGLFGLDDIVRFTHVVESVLDPPAQRGSAAGERILSALLLECGDHIGACWSAAAASDQPADPAALEMRQSALLAAGQVLAAAGVPEAAAQPVEPPVEPRPALSRDGRTGRRRATWHISLRFAPTCCATAWTRCPSSATCARSATSSHRRRCAMPCPSRRRLDPEPATSASRSTCSSAATQGRTIEGVFEFVRDDCADPHPAAAQPRSRNYRADRLNCQEDATRWARCWCVAAR